MTQEQMKQAAANEALKYIKKDTIIGVGTGSTANFFIAALSEIKNTIQGAVASSIATARLLKNHDIKIFELNQVNSLSVYVDGADEANSQLNLIKGGGGALTREKIIASTADKFICIADATKLVKTLGKFPLPVEVIPMSSNYVIAKIEKDIGGKAKIRANFITDNGNLIIDIFELIIVNPQLIEKKLNNIVGVVTNGIFANRGADTLILGTKNGIETINL